MSKPTKTKSGRASANKPKRGLDTLNYLWTHSIIILGFGFGILALIRYWSLNMPTFGLGLLGLFVLIGTLIGMNVLSGDPNFTKGEVRKSIALSFVSVFFGLLMVGDSIDKMNLGSTSVITLLLDKYWVIISTIIVFYFCGRAVENKQEETQEDSEDSS